MPGNMTNSEKILEIAKRMTNNLDTVLNTVRDGGNTCTPEFSYALSYVTSGMYASDSLELAKLVIEENNG